MIRIARTKKDRDKQLVTLVIATEFPHETCWVEGALTMLSCDFHCKFHVLTNDNGEAIIGFRSHRALHRNVREVIEVLNRKGA